MTDWGPFSLARRHGIVTGGAMGIGFGIACRSSRPARTYCQGQRSPGDRARPAGHEPVGLPARRALVDWADDVAETADALGLEREWRPRRSAVAPLDLRWVLPATRIPDARCIGV